MPVLNLTRAEAFALMQAMHLEAGACYEAIDMGYMPQIDVERLIEKIDDVAPAKSEIEHLFKNEAGVGR
jgi:hypothetical protein